jgi:hypothetical protein
MKVGDMVICNCAADVWYKGLIGMLIGYDHHGRYSTEKGDPLVMYPQKTMRLARPGLEVINESR